ncbi:MAG: hypothetical protein M1368_12790, partial [Thaumarchaeota archaeon]|nr:hypothetical protein [Nitrososphaerota archaeon]
VSSRSRPVFCRSSLVLIEGDLTLTNKRLLFVSSKGRPPVTEPEDLVPESTKVVEDDEDPENPPDQGSQSFSIPLSSIVNVEGKRGMLRPSLTVYWRDDSQNPTAKMEFIQKTRRVSSSENINEWGSEILRISFADISLTQKKNSDLEAVDQESVASKILGILDADEWKGLFQIKKELREEYDTDIDIDELETQCNKLVTEKLVERDEIGEFYRKLIPSNSEQ